MIEELMKPDSSGIVTLLENNQVQILITEIKSFNGLVKNQ